MSISVPSGAPAQPLGAEHLAAHQMLAEFVNTFAASYAAPSYGSPEAQMIQPISGLRRALVVKAGSFVKLDVPGEPIPYVWSVSSDVAIPNAEALLDTGAAFTPGRDYHVYLVLGSDNASASLAVSLNTTAPAGADPGASRKIGGFHTLCVAASPSASYVRGGQTVPHELNGFIAGDILPLSIWDLKHRPRQDRTPPPGMTYERYLGFWVDIYPQSGSGPGTLSAYQGTIVHTRQYVDHVEDMFCVGKVLLSDEEFAAAALGSPEEVAVNGATQAAAQDGGAGGRIATNGQRILSYCGCEEMVGCMWQWLRTTSAAGQLLATQLIGQTTANPDAYTWLPAGQGPFLQAGGKGQFYSNVAALLAGGDWNPAAACGSRARYGSNARSYATVYVGGRGREPSGRAL